ncbi:hypothetical protein Tco_1368905, partial [Tanacetum coccineum]
MSDLGCCGLEHHSRAFIVVMSSASSTVTYTSVYTDSEPGKVFWGANEEIFDGGIPRVIVLGYDGIPMQPAHDPDYVPEPIYPKYIPLEDEHELPAEEQPLPPIDSKLLSHPGDDGDDNDGDSFGDDVDDEDVDEDEEDEEEHVAPADSAAVIPTVKLVSSLEGTKPVIPPPSTDISTTGARITVRLQASISLPPEAKVERLLAMTTPSPPSAGERLARIASTQALIDAVTAALPLPLLPPLPPSLYIPSPVDRRDDLPKSELPPRKRLCLSTLGSRYDIGESSTARPTRDLAEAVPE